MRRGDFVKVRVGLYKGSTGKIVEALKIGDKKVAVIAFATGYRVRYDPSELRRIDPDPA